MKERENMKNGNNVPCGLPVDTLSAMTVMGNQLKKKLPKMDKD